MNKCPITYEPCSGKYSQRGLSLISAGLTDLEDFPFTAEEQRIEAAYRASKMSIQGVQPKLSVKLSVTKKIFDVVDHYGTYIIKPQHGIYSQVPENEDVTMKMAGLVGIHVPLTGLIYSKDGSLSYFIKRFDRYGRNKKWQVEDFAQLTQNNRETKYNWSMEKLVPVIDQYCTFPVVEKLKLFKLVIFCFLTGNEDMHLKNFSLITRHDKIEMSPAYDLLNSTIVLKKASEELALPLSGKKRNITSKLLIDYYGNDRLGLNKKVIDKELSLFSSQKKAFEKLIGMSFLSVEMKEKYLFLLAERFKRIFGE